MADRNNSNKECLPKLATGIRGLDKLLYDGINVNTVDGDNNILIVIKGDVEENDKTLGLLHNSVDKNVKLSLY